MTVQNIFFKEFHCEKEEEKVSIDACSNQLKKFSWLFKSVRADMFVLQNNVFLLFCNLKFKYFCLCFPPFCIYLLGKKVRKRATLVKIF